MPRVTAAMKALVERDGKFLFLKQVLGDRFYWDLPGGRVEHGESPFETLHREVREETSLTVEIQRPAGMFWFFRQDEVQVVATVYFCRVLGGDIDLTRYNTTGEQIAESRWLTPAEFLAGDYPTAHQSVREFVQSIGVGRKV